MRKSVLVIGEITLPLVGGIVIAEHDCVEIRYIPTICVSSGRATLNLQVVQVLVVTTSSS